MDEVRCPMCGKSNPAEAEVCLFCQARLKPLVLSPENSDEDQNMPEWLRGLRSAEPPEGDLPAEDDAQEGDLPAEDEAQEDTLDWFSSPEEWEAAMPPAPAMDSPGDEEAAEERADPGDMQDQLPESEANAPQAAVEQEPDSSEDWGSLTNWLESLKQEEPETAQEASAEEQPEADTGETELEEETILPPPVDPTSSDEPQSLSEWLSNPIEEEPAVDWLSSTESEAQPSEEAETSPPAEAAKLPDWLTDLTGDIPEAILEPITTETEDKEAAGESQEQAPLEEPGPVEPEAAEPEASATPAEEAQDLPDWLTQIDRTQEAVEGSSVPAFTDESLAQFEPGELAELEEATAEALSVPDWISDLTAETPAEVPEDETAGEAAPGLAQAKLPDWLEAMRPVEAVAPDTSFLDQSDDHMESAGPLAGLRGIIPGETEIGKQHKPPAYALKIPVSDEQLARVGVLQALMNAEGDEKPLPARPTQTNQLILRIIVFVLLVLASVAALWVGPQTTLPTSDQIAPEVISVTQQVNPLLPNQPVLFVVDYEPGFADEMNTVVMPVLDHLAVRGVHLVFVSTSPTGPILATNLVDWVKHLPAYTIYGFENYTNLGFLPGGANGIRGFALAPAQTLPSKLDGTPAWTGPLSNVQQGLEQFALVVVASDDPEGARQWIEQVGPMLKNKTPLILLTSAQAGPLVQPYYAPQTGLVSGLVSGMAGGADYYKVTGRASTVPLYWDAFSLAVNVTVVFIVLGGFISLITSSITQHKTHKDEENA